MGPGFLAAAGAIKSQENAVKTHIQIVHCGILLLKLEEGWGEKSPVNFGRRD